MNVPFKSLTSSGALHIFKRPAEIIEHHLVRLKQRSLRVQDCDMLRKAIDRLPQLQISLLERRLRPVALDSDKCEAPGRLNHSKVRLRRHARLSGIDRERPENLILFRQYRLGPRRTYPIPK